MTHIYACDAAGNEGIYGVRVYGPESDCGERLELEGSLDGKELESLVNDGVTYTTVKQLLWGRLPLGQAPVL